MIKAARKQWQSAKKKALDNFSTVIQCFFQYYLELLSRTSIKTSA